MNARADMDPMQLCRICAVDVADDASLHLLIEKNIVTELGEKFISCLGIQLMKEGYPVRVCDYCQLQLNTFHAFVRKAKMTSNQFENMIRESKQTQENNEPDDDKVTSNEFLQANEMEFEIEPNNESQDKSQPIEMEFYIDKSKIGHLREGDVIIPVNVDEDEYTIEYLEPEYVNKFVNEIAQNDDDDDDDDNDNDNDNDNDEEEYAADDGVEGVEGIDQSDDDQDKIAESTRGGKNRPRSKRTYPYKCTKCNKRFVYKEVYEAHNRIHKGLPGFSCPHCPKTFNEKANYDYHMQDHTNYRPAKCHLCEKSFKNKQDLASHIRCHKDIRKYMCDVCGKRFRSQSHMTYHRYAHFEARNFACDQCSQKFKSPHILRTHRNTVHSTVFRYECEQCGRKFKRDHHLVAHRRTHNKEPRKPRKKKTEKSSSSPSFEVVDMIKNEELDITFEDETYETEFITE